MLNIVFDMLRDMYDYICPRCGARYSMCRCVCTRCGSSQCRCG